MNWQSFLANIFKLIPYVVAGVNIVHAEKDSATKTQIAQDALQVATAASSQVLSADNAQTAQAVSGAVAAVIAATQAVHDATKAA